MLITTMTAPVLQDLVKKSFDKGLKHRKGGDVRRLFHPMSCDWSVDRKRIQELDRERFAEQKAQGAPSVQRSFAQGYYKEIVRKTVSVTRVVSGEQYKALTAHGLVSMVMNTATDVVDKIELDMRNFIGMGDAVSYTDNGGYTINTTTGDGLAIFQAAHTLKHSATTYSNILAGAPTFSEDSMEDAEDYFNYNVYDNYGQRVDMKPNTIITSPKATMVHRVARLLGSSAPEAINTTANANSGVKNVYQNKGFQHLVIDFDVDAKNVPDSGKSFYWYLARLGGSPESSFQAYYVRWMSPMVAPAEINQDKWVLSYTARSAYGLGAVNGKGMLLVKATS